MPDAVKQIRPPYSRDTAAIVRQRRRLRRRSFLLAEILTLALMLGSVLAGIYLRFTAESFAPLFRILPIAAAMLAALLPIIYFSNPHRRL